jgi:hypothetical protein
VIVSNEDHLRRVLARYFGAVVSGQGAADKCEGCSRVRRFGRSAVHGVSMQKVAGGWATTDGVREYDASKVTNRRIPKKVAWDTGPGQSAWGPGTPQHPVAQRRFFHPEADRPVPSGAYDGGLEIRILPPRTVMIIPLTSACPWRSKTCVINSIGKRECPQAPGRDSRRGCPPLAHPGREGSE